MTASRPAALRGELVRLSHRGGGVRDFALGAARILARAVPFEGVCVLTLNPATLVPTGEVVENGLPRSATVRMAEIEHRGEDFNTWRSLARSEGRAAALSRGTGGDLDRSERHRTVRGPHGLGDELRAALVDDRSAWGALTLLRGSDRDPFSAVEVAVVEAVTRQLAEGLRRAVLLDRDAPAAPGEDAAGVVVLGPHGSIVFADERAAEWIDGSWRIVLDNPMTPSLTPPSGTAGTCRPA